ARCGRQALPGKVRALAAIPGLRSRRRDEPVNGSAPRQPDRLRLTSPRVITPRWTRFWGALARGVRACFFLGSLRLARSCGRGVVAGPPQTDLSTARATTPGA